MEIKKIPFKAKGRGKYVSFGDANKEMTGKPMESLIPLIVWTDKQQSTSSDHLPTTSEFLETPRECPTPAGPAEEQNGKLLFIQLFSQPAPSSGNSRKGQNVSAEPPGWSVTSPVLMKALTERARLGGQPNKAGEVPARAKPGCCKLNAQQSLAEP